MKQAQPVNFRPSGAMCSVCVKSHADCSGLKFDEMKKMRKDKDGTIVVKCSDFAGKVAKK